MKKGKKKRKKERQEKENESKRKAKEKEKAKEMKNESKGKGKEALSGPRTRHAGVPGTPAYPARGRTWHASKRKEEEKENESK